MNWIARIKVHELRNKSKSELLGQLKDLKAELALLRVAKVTGGAPNKLSKMYSFVLSLIKHAWNVFVKMRVLFTQFSVWRMQKSSEAFNRSGIDGDFPEAERSSKGSIQEEEVHATRSPSKEDQGH